MTRTEAPATLLKFTTKTGSQHQFISPVFGVFNFFAYQIRRYTFISVEPW